MFIEYRLAVVFLFLVACFLSLVSLSKAVFTLYNRAIMAHISDIVRDILKELPAGAQLVIAGKGRSVAELMAAIEGGARIIGENYVQELQETYTAIGNTVQWHFIGHLQKNKVKTAVAICDMIETVDSIELAREIDKRCSKLCKTMQVLIEVNSGCEANKSGVLPRDVVALAQDIAKLNDVRLMGLMTMGPPVTNPQECRPCFRLTRQLFEEIKTLNLPDVSMTYLSMGMSDSYKVALEEGANIVRIGTAIFGAR